MLHRLAHDGLLVISQPAHAWISGQIARAWGNADFGEFEPYEDICLAAEQHDLTWLDWEQRPALNLATRLPYTFLELPVAEHTAIWRTAGPRALLQGSRYCALLVSLHGSGLYERRDTSADTPADRESISKTLEVMHAFEAEMLSDLRSDPAYAAHSAPEPLARNRALIACFDYLSLLLCMGVSAERRVELAFPPGPRVEFMLAPVGGDMNQVLLSPWPFTREYLTLQCDARKLSGPFDSQSDLDLVLHAAPRIPLRIRLRQK